MIPIPADESWTMPVAELSRAEDTKTTDIRPHYQGPAEFGRIVGTD
ncbi:hypothetical protein [Streptomyces sp. CB02923]|nr:hypothetical protein [Streptomyces sp. CB02923]